MDYTQIHLSGKCFSGRGVRFRDIDPDERDLVNRTAAKEIGSEGTMAEYDAARAQGGVNRMIVEVTKERDLKDLAGATWIKVTEEELEDAAGERGPKAFKKLFTTKDAVALRQIYLSRHDVTKAELDLIEGNAQAVSAD